MASEVIAPAPPGVQSTFDKPLGPQPSKNEHANKFRKAFAELTHEDVKPKTEEPKSSDIKETQAEGDKPTTPPPQEVAKPEAAPSDKKPESPLDAVLAKTPKEEKPAEQPDELDEFDKVASPKSEDWARARAVMRRQKK